MDNKEFTFWRFIQENTVEIPIIQRDYAQGRLGKEYLRKNFLNNIKQALDGNLPNGEVTLKLDYVYGSMADGKLHPLDGQQRLTTLWLLHWYIAYKAGVLNERVYEGKEGEQNSDTIKDVLKKFTYETRISSREFCEKLSSFDIPQPDGVSIVEHIQNQTWFYSIWMQDPTIQSMLRMLGGTKIDDRHGDDIIDGLEEIFDGIDGTKPEKFMLYWKTLTCESPIVFYYLPLENFGLSDDLYVKMNARGKQLTPFENFKADLINYLRRKKEEEEEDGETDGEWETLLDPSTGITIKMDTDWLDGIFWKNRSSDNKVDDIYYAFMNRFFWNGMLSPQPSASSTYVQKEKENENPSYNYLNKDNWNEYNDLTPYMFDKGEIPISLLKDLQTVLDNYLKYNGEIRYAKWMEIFSFIPQYVEEEGKTSTHQQIKPINQIQRILFFALCKYFKEGQADEAKEAKEQSLTRWMRVVCNLVSGRDEGDQQEIRSIAAVRNAIEHIGRLNSHDVYKSLCDQEDQEKGVNSDLDRRWTEEIYKARKILNDDRSDPRSYDGRLRRKDDSEYRTWEEIIIDAENYAFFNGGIRFLFYNDQGVPQWGDFDIKFAKARKYFKPDSLSNSTSCLEKNFDNAKLLKALISRFDSSQFDKNKKEPFIDKAIFNNRPSTWRFYLMHHSIAEAVHHFLLEESPIIMPHNESENVEENIIYLLSNTDLLDFVIDYKADELKNTRIHCYYSDCWALYPPYKGGYMVCLNSTYRRDRFLAKNASTLVTVGNRVTDTNLFYGKDLPFDFAGKHFNWEINDYVYLMDDEDKGVYSFKNKEATRHDEKFYRFYANDMDDDKIIAEMENLIRQRYQH